MKKFLIITLVCMALAGCSQSNIGQKATCYSEYGDLLENQTIVYEKGDYWVMSGVTYRYKFSDMGEIKIIGTGYKYVCYFERYMC